MKIPAQGKVWLVRHPAAVLASPARYLLGCDRCKTTCNSADPCRCCQAYKTRSAGGNAVFFPDDGKGHRQLMTMTAFRAIAAQEVA